MPSDYNIYCDESCHLENDGINVMTFGAIWCPKDKADEISKAIKSIKVKHGLSKFAEIKWIKVSDSKLDFYEELVDYFFSNPDISFRVLIIPDKTKLDHGRFFQTHDDFYYKMYYILIKQIFSSNSCYNIYLDIKDTQGNEKVKKLHGYLRSNSSHYPECNINKVQQIRSHESQILPLADLLLGAVTYANRGLTTSSAKLNLITTIESCTGFSLKKSTFLNEAKFNIFRWKDNYVSPMY